MNLERIKYLAPIFVALAKGNDVQWKYRHGTVWNKANSGNFNFDAEADWRVAPPPPKDYWIVTVGNVSDRGSTIFDSLKRAEEFCQATTFRIVHVREVVE